jgi:hypothetical protein
MPDYGFGRARSDFARSDQEKPRCTNRSNPQTQMLYHQEIREPGAPRPLTSENMMQITLRVIAGTIFAIWSCLATAQQAPPAPPPISKEILGGVTSPRAIAAALNDSLRAFCGPAGSSLSSHTKR